MAATEVLEQAPSRTSQRFLINVFWNWSHVAITLFSAVILSRYIIRRLGAEGYGLWQLSYSMIGYYGLLDLGFRSAVVYYAARYRAREEYESLNELISTLLVYFSAIGILLVGATFLLSNQVHRLFPVSPEHREAFTTLVLIIGVSIASGIVFNVFSGLVEGFQRFDLANQARIVSFVIRYFGCALLLYLGYGLVAMGVIALIAQLLLNGLYIVITRRIFPAFRFSFKLVRVRAWKETASYGIHTFVASMANTTLEQGPSLVIGHIRGGAYVGYYNLPLRILQYAADAVSRVGIVVAAQASELAAKGRLDIVARLGIYANRYCFTLYTPLAIVVLVYGRELIQLWIGAEYVVNSAPMLPVFLAGSALAMAAQFSSSTILFGIGRHRGYAYWLLIEAAANIVAMAVLVPRYGIFAAAVASTSLMILVRGIITPILACRQLDYPFITYMRSIFVSPVLTALPILILIWSCKLYFWPGQRWLDLISASLVTVIFYWGTAYFTCLEAEHRAQLWEWVRRRAFK